MPHKAAAQNQSMPTSYPLSQGSILQRKCSSCGQHKTGGGNCANCQSKNAAKPLQKLPTIQAKLTVGQPNDKYEQEADRVAEQIMRMPAAHTISNVGTQFRPPTIQRMCATCDEEEKLQAKEMPGSAPEVTPAITSQIQSLQGGGQPLSTKTRNFFEPLFGQDFSHVRVHTGQVANSVTEPLGASAFTIGNHLVFGRNQFNPNTTAGQKLLAHELTHTVQQNRVKSPSSTAIQRQVSPDAKSKTQAAPTIRTIIPFEQGDRITLNHLIKPDIIRLVKLASNLVEGLDEKMVDEAVALLPGLVSRTGTLETITDDRAVIVIDEQVEESENLPSEDTKSTNDSLDIKGAFTIELTRNIQQQSIDITLYTGKGESKQPLGQAEDIKVTKEGDDIKLSTNVEGTDIGIGVTSSQEGNVLTAALSNPVKAQVLQIKRLRNVRKGSAQEKAAVEKAAASASESRAFNRFKVRGDISGIFPSRHPLIGASFQVNFRPIRSVGLFLQMPLEVQLQYAPPSSVLASLNTGAVFSLEEIAPVNIRLITGVSGGSITHRTTKERTNVLGPTVGGGVDWQVTDSFSIGLSYQRLFNLVGNKVDSNIVSLGLGGRFGIH